jgi:hypothetical protein
VQVLTLSTAKFLAMAKVLDRATSLGAVEHRSDRN